MNLEVKYENNGKDEVFKTVAKTSMLRHKILLDILLTGIEMKKNISNMSIDLKPLQTFWKFENITESEIYLVFDCINIENETDIEQIKNKIRENKCSLSIVYVILQFLSQMFYQSHDIVEVFKEIIKHISGELFDKINIISVTYQ